MSEEGRERSRSDEGGGGVPRFIGDLGASRSAELVFDRAVSQAGHLAYTGHLSSEGDSDSKGNIDELIGI